MLARLDLPLLIGETDAFKDYIKTAHNPAFAPVSKQTTGRDLFKYFNGKREKLMTCLQDNVVSSVAVAFKDLTCCYSETSACVPVMPCPAMPI
jgi:hypothetical protein